MSIHVHNIADIGIPRLRLDARACAECGSPLPPEKPPHSKYCGKCCCNRADSKRVRARLLAIRAAIGMVTLLKPRYGAPCNGCGLCCTLALCFVAEKFFGERQEPPCPALIERDGRTWCGAVLAEQRRLLEEGQCVSIALMIGEGCTMPDGDSEKQAAGGDDERD